MDITHRKYRFIEAFMKLINSEKEQKLEKLENLLFSDELNSNEDIKFTEEQIQYLDEIRARHISGKSASMSLDELREKFKDTYGVSN